MTDPMERAMTVFWDPAQLTFRSPELRFIWIEGGAEAPAPTKAHVGEEATA